MNLLCTRCKQWLPESAFCRDARCTLRDGRRSHCKQCQHAHRVRVHAARAGRVIVCESCGASVLGADTWMSAPRKCKPCARKHQREWRKPRGRA